MATPWLECVLHLNVCVYYMQHCTARSIAGCTQLHGTAVFHGNTMKQCVQLRPCSCSEDSSCNVTVQFGCICVVWGMKFILGMMDGAQGHSSVTLALLLHACNHGQALFQCVVQCVDCASCRHSHVLQQYVSLVRGDCSRCSLAVQASVGTCLLS